MSDSEDSSPYAKEIARFVFEVGDTYPFRDAGGEIRNGQIYQREYVYDYITDSYTPYYHMEALDNKGRLTSYKYILQTNIMSEI